MLEENKEQQETETKTTMEKKIMTDPYKSLWLSKLIGRIISVFQKKK